MKGERWPCGVLRVGHRMTLDCGIPDILRMSTLRTLLHGPCNTLLHKFQHKASSRERPQGLLSAVLTEMTLGYESLVWSKDICIFQWMDVFPLWQQQGKSPTSVLRWHRNAHSSSAAVKWPLSAGGHVSRARNFFRKLFWRNTRLWGFCDLRCGHTHVISLLPLSPSNCWPHIHACIRVYRHGSPHMGVCFIKTPHVFILENGKHVTKSSELYSKSLLTHNRGSTFTLYYACFIVSVPLSITVNDRHQYASL